MPEQQSTTAHLILTNMPPSANAEGGPFCVYKWSDPGSAQGRWILQGTLPHGYNCPPLESDSKGEGVSYQYAYIKALNGGEDAHDVQGNGPDGVQA